MAVLNSGNSSNDFERDLKKELESANLFDVFIYSQEYIVCEGRGSKIQ